MDLFSVKQIILFVKRSPKNQLAILIVYVDDIILTGDYEEELLKIKQSLAEEFEVKDLGPLSYFLGMEVARSKKGILVFDEKQVKNNIEKKKDLFYSIRYILHGYGQNIYKGNCPG